MSFNRKKNEIRDESSLTKASQDKLNSSLFLFKALTGRLHLLAYGLPLFIFLFLLHHYITTRYHHLFPALTYYLYSTFFAFVITAVLTPIVMKIARKFNLLEYHTFPKEKKMPTPYIGGVAIYLTFLTVLCFYQPWTTQTKGILLGGTIIWIMGTIDDIRPLTSTLRLVGQLIASGIVISSGLVVSFMPDTVWGNALALVITTVWIIGIINATNFIDGVDGLATGCVVLAAGFFFLITLHLEQHSVAILASILAGCGLGFLIFNFAPSKIILGDGGSTFMGFVLACLALYGGWSNWGPIIALGIPVLILGILIFDVIYITISRIKNGQVRTVRQWLDYHGHDHLHHRLMHMGFKEKEAVIFIYLIAIVLGLGALVIEHARVSYPVVLLLIQATLIFLIISILMLVGRETTP